MKNGKSGLVLFLLILSAIIIGGFLGEFFKDNSFLGFLAWGYDLGTTDNGIMKPVLIDFKMIRLSLGFMIKINFASIAAIVLAIFVYKKL